MQRQQQSTSSRRLGLELSRYRLVTSQRGISKLNSTASLLAKWLKPPTSAAPYHNVVVPALSADRAVGEGDVLEKVPHRLEALNGGSLLHAPIQSFATPPIPALGAEGKGDVLAIIPETARLAISQILATEDILI